jgi:protein pelota
MITDSLFRSKDFKKRQKYIGIIEAVEKNKGEVYIFSSLHSSGKKLNDITGIACIMRFPFDLSYLDEEDDDEASLDSADSSEEEKK